MKLGSMITAGLLVSPALAAAPDTHGADAFVTGLYRDYAKPDAPGPLDAAVSARILSPALLEKIHADQHHQPGDIGKLDHDPICDWRQIARPQNMSFPHANNGGIQLTTLFIW